MRRRYPILLVVLVSAFTLSSCASLNLLSFSKKALGGPESNALIFGSLSYVSWLGSVPLRGPQFVQLNPDAEPAKVKPFEDDTLYFFYPRPVGESWKLSEFSVTDGKTTTTYLFGIDGKQLWDPKPEKPGLFYAGSYEYQEATLLNKGTSSIRAAKAPTELQLLRLLLNHYSGTAWEQVIKDRIQELTK